MEIRKDKYVVYKNEFNNHYTYNDEYVFFNAFLPHLTRNYCGNFSIDMKGKVSAITPKNSEIQDLLSSKKGVGELVFKYILNDQVLTESSSSSKSITSDEVRSLSEALKMFIFYHKQCEDEIASLLGASNFKKENYDSDHYLLGTIDRTIWDKLIALTKMYDLSSDRDELGKYNYTGYHIIMYNLEIEAGYNIKMWIDAIEHLSTDKEVMLGWKIPGDFESKLVVEKLIFNAQESYNFLHNTMIPKTLSIFKG